MLSSEHQALVEQAVTLDESGDHQGAAAIFQSLVGSDISDLDKSMMCLNLATLHDKMRLTDQALQWCERAIGYERAGSRCYAAQHKAAYLARLGRHDESQRLYEALLARSDLTATDREGIRHNLSVLARPGAHLPVASEVVRLGSGLIPLTIAAVLLGFAVLLWAGYQTGRLPDDNPLLVASVLALVAVLAVVVLVAGLSIRYERYELDGQTLRHATLFRTREIPLRRITDVSWVVRLGILPGQFGLFPIPQIVLWSHGKPELRIGVFPSRTHRANLQRLLQALVRLHPAVRLDHALRRWVS
jgi:tetratricopeptide (TPR) repeat protein